MVIIDRMGKISPICISKKLNLYLANPTDDECTILAQELVIENKIWKELKNIWDLEGNNQITRLFQKQFPNSIDKLDDSEMAKILSESMICLYLDLDGQIQEDDFVNNHFLERLDEEDYAEKIIDFISFATNEGTAKGLDKYPEYVPQWLYSSNYYWHNNYRPFINGVVRKISKSDLDDLKDWGRIIDKLLVSEEDEYLFDYLCSAFHRKRGQTAYDFNELYSLCQLFLENGKGSVDDKLVRFLNPELPATVNEEKAEVMRQMRNKIAHGDYKGLNSKVNEYAEILSDNGFEFDYTEYSEQNWVLFKACFELEDALRRILYLLLTNRKQLAAIKKVVKASRKVKD